MRSSRGFLLLWTFAVAAATAAFVLHLGLRLRNIELGYALSEARATQVSFLEKRRVLQLENASLRTPARIDSIARDVLGMDVPGYDRVIPVGGGARPVARTASGRMR
jgi:cell division protein FtsL